MILAAGFKISPMLLLGAGIVLSILFFAAQIQLFYIRRILEEIRDKR